MAKQKGIIKIQGTLGDITFVKTQDGYIAKEKTSVSKSRIASDPAYQRTRENNSEFGRAGKAVKLLRTAIRTLLQNAKDRRTTSRLTSAMMRVVKADATSVRGLRNVMDGETELLQGFEFNINAQITTVLFAAYQANINRATGVLEVTVPSFIPVNDLVIPDGATHYKLVSAGSAIDFEASTFVQENSSSAILPCNATASAPLTLTNTVTANSTHPLFLLFGIQFFQQVNGINYPIKNGTYNALSLVKVSGI
jgi:hypothetical protein